MTHTYKIITVFYIIRYIMRSINMANPEGWGTSSLCPAPSLNGSRVGVNYFLKRFQYALQTIRKPGERQSNWYFRNIIEISYEYTYIFFFVQYQNVKKIFLKIFNSKWFILFFVSIKFLIPNHIEKYSFDVVNCILLWPYCPQILVDIHVKLTF